VGKHLTTSATFFADKLVSLGSRDPEDVYLYAQVLYEGKHYQRALTLLNREGLASRVLEGRARNSGLESATSSSACTAGKYMTEYGCDASDTRIRLTYLTAQCYAAMNKWEECLKVLGRGDLEDVEEDEEMNKKRGPCSSNLENITGDRGADIICADLANGFSTRTETHSRLRKRGSISTISALCLLRGRAYDALDNRSLARHWYVSALKADYFCYEALAALLSQHMLTVEEEQELLASLQIEPGDKWLKFVYVTMGKKYHPVNVRGIEEGEPSFCFKMLNELTTFKRRSCWTGAWYGRDKQARNHLSTRPALHKTLDFETELVALSGNGDIAQANAECLYSRGDFHGCYEIISEVLERDPFQLSAIPCFLSVAVELRRKSELYLCAQKLVEEYPDHSVSWFAVACYYYCVRQFEEARHYFCKSTALEKAFAPAWIGFGHSFAAQDESDQALVAYRTAVRMFPGCHLPLLCIGMEYQRTNNLILAEQFCVKARDICPSDPLTYNELGVLCYRNMNFVAAATNLEKALALAPQVSTDLLEISIVNLAHTHRKLRNFDAAIMWYERALSISPLSASTYTALGFTYQLRGEFQSFMGEAIDCYHKALGLSPEDSFAQEMLTLALIDQCAVTMPPYDFVSYDPYPH